MHKTLRHKNKDTNESQEKLNVISKQLKNR